MNGYSGFADCLQRQHQRMTGCHLVVPIRADQEKMADTRISDELFEQSECRWIKPLEVIKEQDQRVFLLGENHKELPKDCLESVLSFKRQKFRHGLLLTNYQFQFGD